MIKTINTILLAFALLFITACDSRSHEEQNVLQTLENYKQSILANKGSESASYVSSNTIDYYAKMIKLTLYESEESVRSKSFIDRLFILRLRAEFNATDLQQMTGKELFIYSVDHDWIGRDAVETIQITNIVITGDKATSKLVVNGQTAPFGFSFYYENNAWKLDLPSSFPFMNMALVQSIKDSGYTEEQFLNLILSDLGYPGGLSDNLWTPLLPTQE